MIGLLGPDDHRTRRTPGRLIAAQRSETVGGAQLEGGWRRSSPEAPASRPARAVRWLRRRPTVAAALIYLVLSLVMVGQGLLPGWTLSSSDVLYSDVPWKADRPADVQGLGANFELADSVVVFQPFAQYARRRVPDAPLWNPHISAGRPFLADTQNAVFSPFSWPSFVLPFWKSLALAAALKLFVAAFGAFCSPARSACASAARWPAAWSSPSARSSSSGWRGR